MNTQPNLFYLRDLLDRGEITQALKEHLTGYIYGHIQLSYECGRIDGRKQEK